MPTPFSRMDQSVRTDSAHTSIWLLLLGIALVAIWIVWAFSARLTRYEVSDSARLEVAGSAAPVEADSSGSLTASHLTLGRIVQAGEVLLELDDRAEQLALAQERTHRAQLEPQMVALRMQLDSEDAGRVDEERVLVHSTDGARAQLREAQAAAELAGENAARAEKLLAAGLMSVADAQRSQADAKSKRAAAENLSEAALRLVPEQQVRESDRTVKQRQIQADIAKLEAEAAASDQNIKRLIFEIDRRKLLAPISGRISECAILHPGAHISEGQRVGVILPDSQVQVIADFAPASAFGKLRPGQPATVRLNGFPWAQFGVVEGHVSRVAGEIRDGKVRVELALASAPPNIPLQHGLPGVAEVEVERISPAALLLRSAGQALGAH
jgi:multidrug resistance efflux pump